MRNRAFVGGIRVFVAGAGAVGLAGLKRRARQVGGWAKSTKFQTRFLYNALIGNGSPDKLPSLKKPSKPQVTTKRRAGTKKEDLLEGPFAYQLIYPGTKKVDFPETPFTCWKHNSLVPGTQKEDFLETQFACAGDKEGGRAGRPVCLSRGQRRRTSWRGLPGRPLLSGDEGGLPANPIRLCRGQRICPSPEQRRISWKHNSLVSGTKKEDFLQGQFAYPGDKDGGNPANSFAPGTKKEDSCRPVCVCLSWVQRRMTS